MISCNEKLVPDIIDEIKTIDSVVDVQRVLGAYDVVAKLDAPNKSAKEIVQTKIRYINGVHSTLTLLDNNNNS